MKKSKKQIPQKSIRSVDAVRQAAVSVRKDSQSYAPTQHMTRLGAVFIAVRCLVRRAPEKLEIFKDRIRLSSQRIASKLVSKLPKVSVPRIQMSNRLKSVVASTSLVLMMILMFFNLGIGNVARAFEDLNQSDWSGGVGTSPINQYSEGDNVVTNTSNSLGIGAVQNAQWCNTSLCNSQWEYRKVVWPARYTVDLTGRNYVQLEIDIPYAEEMKNDFSDLRFVSVDGTQDIPYAIANITNGVMAKFIVRVPVVAGESPEMLRVYYGNPSAVSVEDKAGTLDIWDEFDQGRVCPQGNPLGCSPSNAVTVGSGELEITSDTYYPAGNYTLSKGVDRVFQVDIKPRDEFGCDFNNWISNMWLGYGQSGYDPSGSFNISTYGRGGGTGCYDAQSQHQLATVQADWFRDGQYYSGGGWLENDQLLRHAVQDTEWMTIRVVTRATGGYDVYSSNNGGASFRLVKQNISSKETFLSDFDRWYISTQTSMPLRVRNIRSYSYVANGQPASLGVQEKIGGFTGTLDSVEYDLGQDGAYAGAITAQTVGSGEISFRVVGSATQGGTAQFGDARNCMAIPNGGNAGNSNCIEPNSRYIKYIAILQDNDGSRDFAVTSINLEYGFDSLAPNAVGSMSAKREGPTGPIVTTGWINTSPYFSWGAATDNGDSGILGYCLYLGEDETANAATTQGLLPGSSPVDTGGRCQYAITDTSLNISQLDMQAPFNSGSTYYLKVRSIDKVGNLSAESVLEIGYETSQPEAQTVLSGPNGTTNNPIVNINWITAPPATALDDGGSGFAGIKYCVNNFVNPAPGCDVNGGSESSFINDPVFYGKSGESKSLFDIEDAIPFSDGGFTISQQAISRLTNEGPNYVYVLAVDRAGNYQEVYTGLVYFAVTQQPPSAPQNLLVNPTSNTENQFSFSWGVPATKTGPDTDVDYCWSVNAPILADASNCNWTGKGITQLAQGAYATQQGVNTLYLMAKDQSQNFSNTNVATVSFSAVTASPGPPQNLELSDVSIRATSSWKIALSWSVPQLPGAGIASYKIYRSTNNVNFVEVGATSTTNLSFIDSGLTQTNYYYNVKACDNAGSCSVVSNTETIYPDGRFTTPARLTDDTDQPKIKDIGTRKATVYWFTDRTSDSKIAYGTAPGQYFPEEVGNSNQASEHVVNLTNLDPGRTYYYVARWTDEDGNTGESQERTFTTLPAPTVREVSATNLTISSANVNFTTENATRANVYFGTSDAFGGVKSINTSTSASGYSLALTDLQDGQKYFYKISTVDADGYEYQGDIYSFTTPARPRIQNLRFETVEGEPSSTQKVVWTTNVVTTSELTYGLVDNELTEAVNSTLVTDHEMIIRGLEDNADYELIARSRDVAGNLAVSDRQFFQTAEDTRAPKISELKVETDIRGSGTEARGQIIVSWRTDEPATSQVAFARGRSTDFTNRSSQDTRLTTEHVVVISDLSTSSIYQVLAVSSDKADNESLSDAQTAIIGRGSENIFSIIFNALQAIFGFGDMGL